MAFIGQCFGTIFVMVVYMQIINIVYESCWLFIIIAQDIAEDLVEFNKNVQTPSENREKMTKRFRELVEIFSDAKK